MSDHSNNKRVDKLIDAVIKVAHGDYSVQVNLSSENDNLDALAMGINMMVDDLKKGRETELENDRIKLLNYQLEEANRKALESDRLKTVFLQNMSHEIRTPLNAIIGFAELLTKNFNNKEKLNNFSSIIKQRGIDLLDLINDILDLSRIETGQLPVNLEDCDLSELLDDLHLFFTNHSQKIGKSHVNLQYILPSRLQQNLIHTDKGKLKQIFVNLIYNALKFTNEGKIEFGCSLTNDNKIEYFVSDSGTGIPPDKQSAIFDRFMQLGNNSNLHKGTGLGLSIVKGLIELLGGDIKLKSEVGEGSTFYFTVPYEIVEASVPKVNLTESNMENNWDRYTILIVEDDPFNMQFLEEVLIDTQINLLRTTNADDAIDLVKSNSQIDIILMDVKLPGMNGLDALRIIKNLKPEIKIIVQTAYALTDDRINAENAGGDGYVSKPISWDILIHMIKEQINLLPVK